VGIELVGENMFFHHLIQFPTFSAHLDVLESELKSAMGIYFDCQFQLTPPAGDVGIELYGENLIFQQVAPTRRWCQSRNWLWEFFSADVFSFHHQDYGY
jgi:hypothetical protein